MAECEICVIGGGAAGLLAAISAGRAGVAATLLERNAKLGIKILMSGGGRCNITNTGDVHHLVDSFPGNGRFLYSAFTRFSNQDILALLAQEGVETKVEDRGRVFPVRDTAKEVVSALERAARREGTEIVTHTRVVEVQDLGESEGFLIRSDDPARTWRAKRLIIATGGVTYPTSGTQGDGYTWARQFGHTIIKPRPSIVALETVETWPAQVKGVALRDVVAVVYAGAKRVAQYREDVLFTHFGLSGPAVLNVSHQAVVAHESHPDTTTIGIRLNADRNREQWLADLEERINAQPQKALKNLLDGWWPASLAPVLLNQVGIDPSKQAGRTSKAERRTVADLLYELRLTLKCPRPIEQAMVTAGGVSVKEVDPKSMESKKRKGLYLAGEVLDVDGISGGYNLQAAYSTGWVAGLSAALSLTQGD